MSGHSHFATIKRKKEATDAAKGKIFSKHAKALQIAIKSGGGADPVTNAKLRFAIEQAKSDNVPRANIERVLSKASEMGDLDEVVYEGYGPGGISLIVEVATDNRNRTAQEIKNIFERSGGSLGGPGSVSFNYETKGLILVEKEENKDDQILKIIDLGVEDVIEGDGYLEVFTNPKDTTSVKDEMLKNNFKVESFSIVKKAKTQMQIDDTKLYEKALKLLESLEDHDDVQDVYTNLYIK